MWKGAKWGGEAIIRVMAGTAGVSNIGNMLELSAAKFLQSLTYLTGLNLPLCLESSAEVAVVQSAGTLLPNLLSQEPLKLKPMSQISYERG